MLLDARTIPASSLLHTDLCIVGAGPAGISLAMEMAGGSIDVLLLEGGGTVPDRAAQELCQGVSTGRAYYALDDCRLRCLGGASHFWGGWCRPLEPEDFEARDWVPHSGWPLTRADLDPYYARAHQVCRLGAYDYDPGRWRTGDRNALAASSAEPLRDALFQLGPTRFGSEYRAPLVRATNVSLMLHGNAIELQLDESRRAVARVRAATLAGNRFEIRARTVVLAAGGIENPRLLLASRGQDGCGIGNGRGLVGRFFTEHLHVPVGVVASGSRSAAFYGVHRANGTLIRGGMQLSPALQRREGLLGCGLTLHNADDPHDVLSPKTGAGGYESVRILTKAFAARTRPDRLWHHVKTAATDIRGVATHTYAKLLPPPARRLTVGCRAEQSPNPESRVMLDDTCDRFGMPRARVHWQLSGSDLDSLRRVQQIWPLALTQNDAARTTTVDESWPERIAAGAHHMGTTRMHGDPGRGVVDEHCRVHGIGNLYVAGSSVFPTAGWAPPTLTIVALALRLADRMKAQLAH